MPYTPPAVPWLVGTANWILVTSPAALPALTPANTIVIAQSATP